MENTSVKQDKKPRRVVSVVAGTFIQLAGTVLGYVLICLNTQPVSIRPWTMIAGYVLVYFSSHSLSHYLAGRLAGIRFTHYSLGGSSHAAAYPTVMRWIFERLPFFAVHAEPASLKSAPSSSKALMFAAGVTGTVLFSTLATLCAYNAGVRGALVLVGFNIFWQIGTVITESRPGGDIAKARAAWQTH